MTGRYFRPSPVIAVTFSVMMLLSMVAIPTSASGKVTPLEKADGRTFVTGNDAGGTHSLSPAAETGSSVQVLDLTRNNITGCSRINRSGVYHLTTNITVNNNKPCIRINSSDVVFDGNGYTIKGVGNASTSEGFPIRVRDFGREDDSVRFGRRNLTNVTVRNVRVVNWGRPIQFVRVHSAAIRNVDVIDSFNGEGTLSHGRAIAFRRAKHPKVLNTRIINASSHGIQLQKARFAEITGSTIKDIGNEGIVIYQDGRTANHTIKNNVVDGARQGILAPDHASHFLLIVNNTVRANARSGIKLEHTRHSLVIDNTVSDNKEGIIVRGRDSGNTTVFGNTLQGNRRNGIRLTDSDHSLVQNNTVRRNGRHGIRLRKSDNSTIRGNLVVGNGGNGISIKGVANATITNNVVANQTGNGSNGHGIQVDSGSNRTRLVGNVIHENKRGVRFESRAGSSVMVANKIVNNSDAGVLLSNFASVERIEIHRNVISNNGRYGVQYWGDEGVVNATQNWWGSPTGPASPSRSSINLTDPYTGAIANGSGDPISENGSNTGVSNVHFDPYLKVSQGQVSVTIGIEPTRTYLHVNNDAANATKPLRLADYGIEPGDRIRLERLGRFEDGTAGRGMLAVFSTNATLLPGGHRHRVPGAIDAGTDYATARTWYGNESTDIPEDFLVADNSGVQTAVTVTVPADARYLFIAGQDNFYEDNSDPDGDFGVRITELKGPKPGGQLPIGQFPTLIGRGLIRSLQVGELTIDLGSKLLDSYDPATSGAILEYVLTHGNPIRAAELLDGMSEQESAAVLKLNPEFRRIVTNHEFQQMREGMSRLDLARLVVEQEEGEFFDASDSDVEFNNVSEFSNASTSTETRSDSNQLRTRTQALTDQSTPSTPGRGYDEKVRWKKVGRTGFGLYAGLDVSNNGAILTIAGGRRSGGLWRKEDITATVPGAWARVGNSLDASHDVVDAAIDPNDPDHLYAIIPETDETFGLYESRDGGRTWTKDDNFSAEFMLKDDKRGVNPFVRGARVEMFDDGNVFVYNYEDIGANRTLADFSLHLQGSDAVDQSVNLAGMSDVRISYWERGYSFEGVEAAELQLWDGEQWRTLKTSGSEFEWRKRTATVPTEWLAIENRLRFKFTNGGPYDHWLIDNLTVSSADGTVLKDNWEDGNLNGWSATRKPTVVDADTWVYYSPNNGSTWQAGSINISDATRPGTKTGYHFAKNRVSFSATGHGVINPTGKQLFVTRDYGQSWEKLGNYSAVEALTYDVANDGTVHVAYNDNNVTFLDTYGPSGAKTTKGANLSTSLPNRDEGPALCKFCPQVMAVDPADPSHITLFLYGAGPYESQTSGAKWTRLFNLPKTIYIHSPQVRKKLRINNDSVISLQKPTDYRDVDTLDSIGQSDRILIGSDQGLFVMDPPPRRGKDGKEQLELINIAGSMDHSQVYDVNVDECGNLYHGLWHASAMVRIPGSNKDTKQRWMTRQQFQARGQLRRPLQLNYDLYYYGGGESAQIFVKNRSDCLSWASKGGVPWANVQFSPYVTNDSGTVQKRVDSGSTVNQLGWNVSGRPQFFDGRWHYVDQDTNNLNSTNLSSKRRSIEARNVKYIRKDDSPNGGVGEALWYVDLSKKQLKRFDGASRVTNRTTATDLRGSDLVIQDFDVQNGRVITNFKFKGSNNDRIFIYDTARTAEPVTKSDVLGFGEAFTDLTILEVFVDPTNPSRYFASVKDLDNPQCRFHLMVTEDGGDTWQKFSEEMDCHVVWDLAFNENTERIYAATHGRGVLRGNLTELNQGRANLGVSVACGDTKITENEIINCTVSLETAGNVSEWRDRVGGPNIDIDLPYRSLRYTIPGFRRLEKAPWQRADCYTLAGVVPDSQLSQTGRITCADPLRNFPPSGEITFQIDLQKRLTETDPVETEITATLNFTAGAPDTNNLDNTASESLEVYGLSSGADRFDYHVEAGRVIRNDRLENATVLTDWSHSPSQHFACPADPQYPGGATIVKRLRERNEDCSGIVTNASDDAPLSAIERWSQTVEDLELGIREDFFNFSIPPLHVRDRPACGTFDVSFNRQTNRSKSFRFTLSESYRDQFNEPFNREHGDVDASLRQAFRDNGVNLSSKAFIDLPKNVSDWDAGRWVVNDVREYLVVEQANGSMKVYHLRRGPHEVVVNKTVSTAASITINVTEGQPINNDAYEIGLNTTKVRPGIYTASGDSRTGVRTIDRHGEVTSIHVDCPRSKDLEHLILSLGESNQVGGGYDLSIDYRVKFTRGAARNETPSIGQYDEFGVDFDGSTDWYDRQLVDVEELNRKILASELELNPDQPPEEAPALDLSVTTTDRPTGTVPPLDRVVQVRAGQPYITIEHDKPFRGRARLTFSLSQAVLDRRQISPDRISLYRYDGGRGWQSVITSHLAASGGRHRYRAEFSGLSVFAIGVEPAPVKLGTGTAGGAADAEVPVFRVRDVRLGQTTITAGESVEVTATIENIGDESGTFTAGLLVDGQNVTRTSISVAAEDEESVSFDRRFQSPGTYTIAINGTEAGRLTVYQRETPTPTKSMSPVATKTVPATRTIVHTPTVGQTVVQSEIQMDRATETPVSEPSGLTLPSGSAGFMGAVILFVLIFLYAVRRRTS